MPVPTSTTRQPREQARVEAALEEIEGQRSGAMKKTKIQIGQWIDAVVAACCGGGSSGRCRARRRVSRCPASKAACGGLYSTGAGRASGHCATTRPASSMTTRSAQARAKSPSCVATTTVRPCGRKLAQRRRQLAAARRIERRRRLVHQQHRRIDGQRAGDRHALRLAARQLVRQRGGALADAQHRRAARGHGARRRRAAAAARAPAPATRCAARVRCANRWWNWNTMPTRVQTRSRRRAASGDRSPAIAAQGSCVLPEPDGPMSANALARAGRERHAVHDGPSAAAYRRRRAASSVVMPAASRFSRRRARRASGSDSTRYIARAQQPGHDPAADVRGEDRRLLRQLDDGDDRDERAVLEQRDEVVGHRRQRQAERLRAAHEQQRLPVAEAERPRGVELSRRHGLERAAIDLALVGGVVQAEPDAAPATNAGSCTNGARPK